MATLHRVVPSNKEIPNKRYFRIGEVSSLTSVESYVLRFWETEFKSISPKRTESGQRLYRKKDVELIFTIKHLLYEKKFTIQGAKQYLRSERKQDAGKDRFSSIDIDEIRTELQAIRDLLV
ncbi:MAG: MerR family transcriptional regulator [Deltaproteobacteria bacterium]|nr:MerR family transcriptional regulator [Deltaproteobacteria bacterium]